MSEALIIIDAQNEFSSKGKRPVSNFVEAIHSIEAHLEKFRHNNLPVAWVRHFNKPTESRAFVPDTWGSEFYNGSGPASASSREKEFQKDVYGAFTGSDLGQWLTQLNVHSVLIVGFYTHGCVSTTTREAIMRNLNVFIDPHATGACDMVHNVLGKQSAHEVKLSALLHLENMGASVYNSNNHEA